MPKKLPMLILQFAIKGHIRRTEHWAIAVITDAQKNNARLFEMAGNMDTFAFRTREEQNFAASRSYCGGVHVGEVDVKELENLEEWLQGIAVRRNDPLWDCQDWVIDALRVLKMDRRGIVFDGMTDVFIRGEMREEQERDQTGQDIVHERLKT